MTVPPMFRTDRALARVRRLQWLYPRDSISTEIVARCFARPAHCFERQPAPTGPAPPPSPRPRLCVDFASSTLSSAVWTRLGRAYARLDRRSTSAPSAEPQHL